MDIVQFTSYASNDKQIKPLLEKIASDAKAQADFPTTPSYTLGGVEIVIGIAAYALYRWLRDYLDYVREQKKVDIAERQRRVIAQLIADGFEPDKAQAVTASMIKAIGDATADDPVLKTALSMIQKSG